MLNSKHSTYLFCVSSEPEELNDEQFCDLCAHLLFTSFCACCFNSNTLRLSFSITWDPETTLFIVLPYLQGSLSIDSILNQLIHGNIKRIKYAFLLFSNDTIRIVCILSIKQELSVYNIVRKTSNIVNCFFLTTRLLVK